MLSQEIMVDKTNAESFDFIATMVEYFINRQIEYVFSSFLTTKQKLTYFAISVKFSPINFSISVIKMHKMTEQIFFFGAKFLSLVFFFFFWRWNDFRFIWTESASSGFYSKETVSVNSMYVRVYFYLNVKSAGVKNVSNSW